MTNAEVVRRYVAAQIDHDYDTMGALRHSDFTARWPQSGEVVHGNANMRAILEHYPGGQPKMTLGGKLVGSEDRWAVSPLGGAYKVVGEGENWWGEWLITYPDGKDWRTLVMLELRDGKILRETMFWAEPFDAPAWRAQWVEHGTTSEHAAGEAETGGRTLP